MKRILIIALGIALGLGACIPPASANSWGLTGKLLEAVMEVSTWDDYTTLTKQVGDIALMQSRKHNVLMMIGGENQTLQAYSKAVYQPDDGRDGEAMLTKTSDLLTLSYGSMEWYTFVLEDDIYVLQEAVIGDFHIIPAPDNA